jgi:hypothetical protein
MSYKGGEKLKIKKKKSRRALFIQKLQGYK